MSSHNYKKESEREVVDDFNDHYEEITDDYLEVIEQCERPDFLCKRKNGEIVGIEVVQIINGHPDDKFYNQVIKRNNFLPNEESIDLIQSRIYEKSEKLKENDWKLANNTILIIQLSESPLWEIQTALTNELFPDLKDYGFKEIWFVDYSEFEAYQNVELFCLYPEELKGYYRRGMQKPYG